MTVATTPFPEVVARRRPSLGIWLSLASPLSADVAAGSALDWALIDAEHSPLEIGDLLQQLRALEGSTVTPVVRVPHADPTSIKRLLDVGAHTIMLPMIENGDQARRAVACGRYPPAGIRGVAASVRSNNFGRRRDYYRNVEQEISFIAQIETVAAVDRIDEIARVDGIRALFVGPSDLAASAGAIGRPDDPAVRKLVERSVAAAAAAGIPVGTLAGPRQPAGDCIAMGFDFVAVGSDVGLLREGLDRVIETLRADHRPRV